MKPTSFFNRFSALFGCSLLLLAGCRPGEPKQPPSDDTSALKEITLPGTWELADISKVRYENAGGGETDKAMLDLMKGQMLKNGLVISLFSDSTFTQISGDDRNIGDKSDNASFPEIDFMDSKGRSYLYGRWKTTDNNTKLILAPQNGGAEETREIRSLDAKFMTLHVVKSHFSFDLRLRRTGKPLENLASDPFHPAMNQWRIVPKQAETAEQLRARMRNHVEHYIAVLEASLERNQKSVSLKYSPSVIQIYNGGIGIREKKYWDEAFMQCFHSPKDAQKGVDIYTGILKKGLSLGAGTGDWVKDDANLLRVILTELQ